VSTFGCRVVLKSKNLLELIGGLRVSFVADVATPLFVDRVNIATALLVDGVGTPVGLVDRSLCLIFLDELLSSYLAYGACHGSGYRQCGHSQGQESTEVDKHHGRNRD
jgi:hypothetical protein